MRLEPTPRPEQTLRVSARLITASTILHLSSDELERCITQEQTENPALEVQEQRVCLFCGTLLRGSGSVCTSCGYYAPVGAPEGSATPPVENGAGAAGERFLQPFYDMDNYGFVEADAEAEDDPLARIATPESLAERLLQQLEALIPPEEAPIAEHLVGNLNERGYLEISTAEISRYLDVPLERVEYVLKQLQTLEPVGIGARDLRECLLIQLEALAEQETPHPLARTLIERHLDRLGRSQYQEIARELKVPEQEVRAASAYIRSRLYPFPAHTYRLDSHASQRESSAMYVHPDVIIRRADNGFEVELIEEKRYHFAVNRGYHAADGESASLALQRYFSQQSDRARFFIDCVQRRWRTLKRVAEIVVEQQRDFLEKGIRYLRPLTRAEVAARLGLDEGTVSRATANKYALLPNGRLIPFSDFFDSSLGVKDILREIIQQEAPQRRLSDEELRRLLAERGIHLARRTVTKYREEMGIGSSRER
ncbi:MAG: RNA polymerase factor sigma-54 [Thermogemmatispora sp.]|uniref:RNA polymerase factor sigma-54 n=1 Tax=Thermogemmatispora sp. TaxID=1968838 RepID=UPI0026394B64|nr:RNA polymerase factor sigma-54 [Thermogemmatispora sp.]MBX5458315.1 RNA polymerase factor sigma-54 [Thermogemmatispora sp.]